MPYKIPGGSDSEGGGGGLYAVQVHGARYAYLFESDGVTLNPDIKSDIDDGKINNSDRFDWASRLPPSTYADGKARGAAGGALALGGAFDGGSVIDIGSSRRIVTDIGCKTDIYQWGVIGNGDNGKTRIEAAVNYLSTVVNGGVLDYLDAKIEIDIPIVLSGKQSVTITASGNAVLSKPASSTSDTQIYSIVGGCKKITLKNHKTEGNYDEQSASTGSSPGIQIGTQTANDDVNEDILIQGMEMVGHNWAAVILYARAAGGLEPLNKRIHVLECEASKSVNGFFCYKGGYDINVGRNYFHTLGNNGITFDTRAASDSEGSYPIDVVNVFDNEIDNYGHYGQGSGVLLKGDIRNAMVKKTRVSNAVAEQVTIPPANFGILINQDADGSVPPADQCAVVIDSVVKNIDSAGLNGHGIYIGQDQSWVELIRANIKNTKTTGLYCYRSSVRVQGTRISDTKGYYAARFQGVSGNIIDRVILDDIRLDKGVGVSTVGIQYDNVKVVEYVNEPRIQNFPVSQTVSNAVTFEGLLAGTEAERPAQMTSNSIYHNTTTGLLNKYTGGVWTDVNGNAV